MAFVGREPELALLAGALQRAAEGARRHVLIRGEAGMGASTSLDELESRLGDLPGVVVARGIATEPQARTPFAAVAAALERALAALPDDRLIDVTGPRAYDLCVVVPAIARRLEALGISTSPPTFRADAQLGDRVIEGIVGTLDRLTADGALLIALEDLHWADPATRRFVGTLLHASHAGRLCLVLTYQPDQLHRRHPAASFLDGLAGMDDVELIDLIPFTPDEIADLAEAASGERPSAAFLAALVEGSRGNPLQAGQLLEAHARLEGLRLSDPFDEVLGARLDALSGPALRAVRVLALARRPLEREVCLALRLPDGRLTRAGLEEAVSVGLASAADTTIGIAHERYAEGIEALAVPPERRSIHAALAASAPFGPAEAAWHWSVAARPVEARRRHLDAAREAERLDPGETALLHYLAALDLADADPAAADAASDLSETLAAGARAAAAAGAFRRAAALVKRALDARPRRTSTTASAETKRRSLRLGELYEEWGRYRWAGGDFAGGVEQMERALAILPREPSRERARALAVLAQHHMIDGRFDESATLAREASDVASRSSPQARGELGHATCTLGVDLAYLGDLDAGLALLESATEIARETGRLDDLMRAYANRTTLLDLDSRREAALAVVNDGVRDARAAGLAETYGAFLRGNAADILFMLGRWQESEVECRAAMGYRPADTAWFSPILYLGLVAVESRADEEAVRLVGQTLLQLEQVPAGQWTALVMRAAVSLLLWGGQPAEAVEVAAREWHRVLETADPLQIAMAASTALEAAAALAEAGREDRDLGAVGTAGELAARALADAERQVAASRLAPTLGARREAELHLEMARAHLGRLRGRPSAARWAKLAEAWAAIPVPYQAAKSHWWQALALLQARDGRAAARAPLLDAWRISGELPAQPLRRALADLARRGRIVLPDVRPTDLERPTAIAIIPVVPDRARPTPRALVAVGPGRPATGDADRGAIETRVVAIPDADGPPFGLSPREFEVLLILAEGRTNREIAERLFISERTVGVHVRRILAKLGVSGRVQAAGVAIRLGLVPEPPAVDREESRIARPAPA